MPAAKPNRLLLKLDAETVMDCAADQVAEGFEVGGAGAFARDQRKAVAGRDADRAEAETLAEAGALQQPGGGELDAVGASRPVRCGIGGKREGLCDAVKGCLWNDGVLEKRAGAAAVGIAGGKNHALGPADLADGAGDLAGGRRGVRAEMPKQIRIGETRTGAKVEAEGDGGDDVAAGLDGVEQASAVAELAGFAGKLDEAVRLKIQSADSVDGLRNLLPVGANILHRGASGKAGDAGEALDAGQILITCLVDKGFPGETGVSAELASGDVDLGGFCCAVDSNVDDQSGKSGVGDKKVAAAAEREQGKGALAGEVDGREEFCFGANGSEEARRTAELKCRQRGQRDVLAHGKGLAWLHSAVIPKLRSGWRGRGRAPTMRDTDRFCGPKETACTQKLW